jgi:hypothetical protein
VPCPHSLWNFGLIVYRALPQPTMELRTDSLSCLGLAIMELRADSLPCLAPTHYGTSVRSSIVPCLSPLWNFGLIVYRAWAAHYGTSFYGGTRGEACEARYSIKESHDRPLRACWATPVVPWQCPGTTSNDHHLDSKKSDTPWHDRPS